MKEETKERIKEILKPLNPEQRAQVIRLVKWTLQQRRQDVDPEVYAELKPHLECMWTAAKAAAKAAGAAFTASVKDFIQRVIKEIGGFSIFGVISWNEKRKKEQ